MALAATLDVDNDLTISKGSLNSATNSIVLGGNFTWSNTTGAISNTSITFDGGATKTFTYTNAAGATFTNLTMNKTGSGNDLILGNSLTVSGALTMTGGDIIVGARTLTLGNTATLSGGSATSYLQADGVGYVKKNYNAVGAVLNLPLGDINDYSPLAFKLNSGTLASASVSFNVTDGVEPNMVSLLGAQTNYISRWWEVLPSGISGSISYDMSVTYVPADVVGTESGILFAKYSTTTTPKWRYGTNYTSYNTNTSTHTLSATGITSFSDITGVNSSGPLPISLLTFSAVRDHKVVDLTWTTATELNNNFFTVERSSDSETFDSVKTVDGAGNSSAIINYRTTDEKPLDGVSYYRLKQTDFDGKYTYSNVVAVYFQNEEDLFNLSVFPNPVENTNINLTIQGAENQKVLIVLRDIFGNEHYSKMTVLEKGLNTFEIEKNDELPAGIYFVIASSNKKIVSQKIIVR